MKLTGRIAMVTGGAQGIGRAIAERFLDEGCKVTIIDLNEELGKVTEEELQKTYEPDSVMFKKCDITSDTEFDDAFFATKAKFGEVNILINNAGVTNEENWRLMLKVNLVAQIEGTYLSFEHMTIDGTPGGDVVNIESNTAFSSSLDSYLPAYSASRAGGVRFTRCIGNPDELAETGVRVNAVCPSATATKQRAKLRIPNENVPPRPNTTNLCTTSEVADAVVKVLVDGRNGSVLLIRGPGGDVTYIPDQSEEHADMNE
jgi:15-hydroxyprostaglandin dehydrogenase (NAD)